VKADSFRLPIGRRERRGGRAKAPLGSLSTRHDLQATPLQSSGKGRGGGIDWPGLDVPQMHRARHPASEFLSRYAKTYPAPARGKETEEGTGGQGASARAVRNGAVAFAGVSTRGCSMEERGLRYFKKVTKVPRGERYANTICLPVQPRGQTGHFRPPYRCQNDRGIINARECSGSDRIARPAASRSNAD